MPIGALETKVDQILDRAINETPLSQGGTWGDLLGIAGEATLTPGGRELLVLSRKEGLEHTVRLIARHLDTD
jgi:hypothetical protein